MTPSRRLVHNSASPLKASFCGWQIYHWRACGKFDGQDYQDLVSLLRADNGELDTSYVFGSQKHTNNILILYKSGLDLVFTKTRKAKGKRFRRWLVDELFPALKAYKAVGNTHNLDKALDEQWSQLLADDPSKESSDLGGYRGSMRFFTERGYIKLTKPTGDDISWQVFDFMLAVYFRTKELEHPTVSALRSVIDEAVAGVAFLFRQDHDRPLFLRLVS